MASENEISLRERIRLNLLDGMKNRQMAYDDELVRKLIKCVVVESEDQIKVVFCGGLQVEQPLRQDYMDFVSDMRWCLCVYSENNGFFHKCFSNALNTVRGNAIITV